MKRVHLPGSWRPVRHGRFEHGVVLVFVLVALVVMLVASVALVRSFNTSLFNAGNLAFKRDLANQAERVLPIVRAALSEDGALGTEKARAADVQAQNYKATILKTNAQGIPLVLLGANRDFEAVGSVVKDIELPDQQVKVRYVVDRLCNSLGLDSDLGADHCSMSGDPENTAGSESDLGRVGGSDANANVSAALVVYRVTIRVDGPRNTQAFFQTTLTPNKL